MCHEWEWGEGGTLLVRGPVNHRANTQRHTQTSIHSHSHEMHLECVFGQWNLRLIFCSKTAYNQNIIPQYEFCSGDK